MGEATHSLLTLKLQNARDFAGLCQYTHFFMCQIQLQNCNLCMDVFVTRTDKWTGIPIMFLSTENQFLIASQVFTSKTVNHLLKMG